MAEIIKGKKGYTDAQICCFMYGLVVLMMAVLGSPLGISYILDETGTVANAAYLDIFINMDRLYFIILL